MRSIIACCLCGYVYSLMILHADVGSRRPLQCGSGSTYFSILYECVPNTIVMLPVFVDSFDGATNVCPRSGPVRTLAELESLRFCDTINGSLVIEVDDAAADYTVFRDIEVITGKLHFDLDLSGI